MLEPHPGRDIFETSYSPFVKFDLTPLPWLRFVTGARGDIFNFNVHNNLTGVPDQPNGSADRAIPSAKANLVLGPGTRRNSSPISGRAFTATTRAPSSQDPTLPALAQAHGLGVRDAHAASCRAWKLSFTYWWLNLSSELVFIGDDGTTEPSGPSHRAGLRVQPEGQAPRLAHLHGQRHRQPTAEFFNGKAIPLAPRLTAFADLTARLPWGLSASATMRYIGNRYADEERHQTARGYTLFDFGARYRYKLLVPSPSTPSSPSRTWPTSSGARRSSSSPRGCRESRPRA